jgi:hypothetical protein
MVVLGTEAGTAARTLRLIRLIRGALLLKPVTTTLTFTSAIVLRMRWMHIAMFLIAKARTSLLTWLVWKVLLLVLVATLTIIPLVVSKPRISNVFNVNLKAVSFHPWTATIIDWIGGHEITDSLSSFKDGYRLGAVHGVVVISSSMGQ